MNNSLNRRLATMLLMTAVLAGTTISPRPANAIMGIATANVALAVLGGGLMGGAIVATKISQHYGYDGNGLAEVALFIGGLVALDAKGQATPLYTAVTSEQASAYGMSEVERAEYNDALDKITTMGQNIVVQSVNQPITSTDGASQLNQFIQMSWEKDGATLSPEAYSGLQKVQKNISSSFQAGKY